VRNRKLLVSTTFIMGFLSLVTLWYIKNPKLTQNELSDKALLALVKNDQDEFVKFLNAGGNVHQYLPLIDGKKYTVAEGVAHFERIEFAKILRERNVAYIKQNQNKSEDVMTIAIKKNNPELLKELVLSNPRYDIAYGKDGWTLLHMASACCAHKLTAIIHEKSHLRWDEKSKDGRTPLSIANEKDCIPMMNYWRDQGASVVKKDKKERAKNVVSGTSNAAPIVPDFYKKRKVPKDQIIDHTAMLEPGDRPLESSETSKFSEFAD
jgi:ankyrin repeat protein